MRSAIDPTARLMPLVGPALPAWCDRYLAPADGGDFFAGRIWHDTILAHALPPGAQAVLAVCGPDDAVLVPLLRQGGRLGSLVTPYNLEWRPLAAPGAGLGCLRDAGHGLGRLLRGQPPTRLEALDPAAPGLAAMLTGVGQAGMALGHYSHFGNWRQHLTPGVGWDGYFAARPPALRTTILRKLARAGRETRLTLDRAPGDALERGIAAYLSVRANSWKPPEPFPHFDAVLLRAAAGVGALRLGVLWGADGQPVAAQYWIVSGGRAVLLKLAHDEAARAASPGTALTALMIRSLIEDDGVTELDFGRGDDPYKQLWVAERRQRIGIVLTDPWHPAGLFELARQAASHGRKLVLDLLKPAGSHRA